MIRLRSGDTGLLPVIVGFILISIIFQSLNSNFLSAGNIVNLLVQGSIYMLLAMAEVYVLLLGEIDLSAGFVAGVAGVITAELLTAQHGGWPWYAACLAALAVTAIIGAFHGTLITRIGLPSFVVTLAGLLGFQGVMLLILGDGGTLPIQDNIVNDFANGNLTPTASWIVAAGVVAAYGAMTWLRDSRRRKSGLVAPPTSITLLKIGGAAVAAAVITIICNTNRGVLVPIRGIPWVVLIVLGVLVAWTVLLGRTRFGRYVYAIGGNSEAARRAGIPLARVRTWCFVLCSFTAGIAGIVYASRLRSVSTNLDGGTLVLYTVAAAVIGGTSLFGGRGRIGARGRRWSRDRRHRQRHGPPGFQCRVQVHRHRHRAARRGEHRRTRPSRSRGARLTRAQVSVSSSASSGSLGAPRPAAVARAKASAAARS